MEDNKIMYRVFSIDCSGEVTPHTNFISYSRCKTWIRNKNRMGLPTHFYIISSLDSYSAKQKYSIGR